MSMRIVQLVPGSGNFYCENCLRDSLLVDSLRRMGHDVQVVPLYLPITFEGRMAADERIFFGGINCYLQQRSPLFRLLPAWMDRPLNSPRLLRRLVGQSSLVDASLHGEMTLSMLRGPAGRQAKELRRLVKYLKSLPRPDVLCLPNALLLGLAGPLRRELDCPMVCVLRDEEVWLDQLGEAYADPCWQLMRQAAADVDAFIAPSDYYRERMVQRLGLDGSRVHRLGDGIDLHLPLPAPPPTDRPIIAYVSQIAHERGLDLLLEAAALLRQRGLADLELRVCGSPAAGSQPYLQQVRSQAVRLGLEDCITFVGDLSRDERRAFLSQASVVCVPSRRGEAFGLFALESIACGTPVVLPRHGAFVELVEQTGGGLLHEVGNVDSIAEKLQSLLADPHQARAMARCAQSVVAARFEISMAAAALVKLFETLRQGPVAGNGPAPVTGGSNAAGTP